MLIFIVCYFVVSHKHKKEAGIAASLLAGLALCVIAFFLITPFRFYVEDAYHSIFKLIIADRVLKDDAVIHSNIAYCGTNNPRQTLDLYLPDNDVPPPHGLVVFVHGGAWRGGDKSTTLLSYYGKYILKSGAAIAALNYRLYPEVTYPKPNDDVACALSYLQAHAAEYNISTERWAIFGDSAGAQLAAYAMSDERVNRPLKLFIGFYGPYNLEIQIDRKPSADIAAFHYTNDGKDRKTASVLDRPGKQDATYLLFHGEKDRIVPISQSENFYKKLKNEGIDVVFTRVKNAGHSFSQQNDPSNTKIQKQIMNALMYFDDK